MLLTFNMEESDYNKPKHVISFHTILLEFNNEDLWKIRAVINYHDIYYNIFHAMQFAVSISYVPIIRMSLFFYVPAIKMFLFYMCQSLECLYSIPVISMSLFCMYWSLGWCLYSVYVSHLRCLYSICTSH